MKNQRCEDDDADSLKGTGNRVRQRLHEEHCLGIGERGGSDRVRGDGAEVLDECAYQSASDVEIANRCGFDLQEKDDREEEETAQRGVA